MDLRYPTGRFLLPAKWTASDINEWTDAIAAAPGEIQAAVDGLDADQLDTPYRDGGWTVLQLVHHVSDSHLNGYVRCKLALTEDNPIIKPYDQDKWAELPDSAGDVSIPLVMLAALHARWSQLLRALPASAFDRVFTNPESGEMSLAQHISLYAWHGWHHVSQILALRKRKGW